MLLLLHLSGIDSPLATNSTKAVADSKRGYTDSPYRLLDLAASRWMLASIAEFEEVAPARRRSIGGKSITVREYVIDAGAKDFLVLYWVPPEPDEPLLLLNIRIGGQTRFRWKQ